MGVRRYSMSDKKKSVFNIIYNKHLDAYKSSYNYHNGDSDETYISQKNVLEIIYFSRDWNKTESDI